ncbi:hypothetical protein, partial [Escherichia coli]|uniref:hypothetical protein n=1 Tax=Escherichia coli TaxID=562 RepID=UPI001BAFD315
PPPPPPPPPSPNYMQSLRGCSLCRSKQVSASLITIRPVNGVDRLVSSEDLAAMGRMTGD